MDKLKIGYYVLTGHKRYEPIYSFGHYDPTRENVEYLKFLPTRLKTSTKHLVYIGVNLLQPIKQKLEICSRCLSMATKNSRLLKFK